MTKLYSLVATRGADLPEWHNHDIYGEIQLGDHPTETYSCKSNAQLALKQLEGSAEEYTLIEIEV